MSLADRIHVTLRRGCGIFLLGVLAMSGAHAGDAAGARCELPGEPVQWLADLCMLELQTDDEIAAGDCIAACLPQLPADRCAALLAAKRAMCAQLVALRAQPSIVQCMADPAVIGRTVANDGVGEASVPPAPRKALPP